MIGLLDALKLGTGAVAGAALLWAWFTFITVPAAEVAAFTAGEVHCQREVAKKHAAELARQQAANDAALEQARNRERELADQADTLNDQLLDLANAITSDDSSSRLCLGAERVRDLNAIR